MNKEELVFLIKKSQSGDRETLSGKFMRKPGNRYISIV